MTWVENDILFLVEIINDILQMAVNVECIVPFSSDHPKLDA
jgi:hypothetical protein